MSQINKKLSEQIVNHMSPLLDQEADIIANMILEEAKSLTPVETGKLKNSAIIIRNDKVREVVFQEPYALYVHEDLNARHTIGEAKFLEKAVLKVTGRYR